MHRAAIAAATALVVAACGGSGVRSSIAEPTEATSTTTTTTTNATPNATTTTTASTTSATTGGTVTTTKAPGPTITSPGTDPNQGARPDIGRPSTVAALLPDDALAAPWELQLRRVDEPGFGVGANQTDCESYWLMEELRGADGSRATWWTDGGRADQYVSVLTGQEALDDLVELAFAAQLCPVVRWNEGGSFTTENVTLRAGFGFKFTDEESGEVTWSAVARAGDLVSVLDVAVWAVADGAPVDFDADDLDGLAIRMNALVARAASGPRGSSPVTVPPSDGTPSTTLEPAVTGVGTSLLEQADLPTGFSGPRRRLHEVGDADTELVESCPAAASIEIIDSIFEWAASADGPDGMVVQQYIGVAASAEQAAEVIAQYADVAACDLSAAFADTDVSGGPIEIQDADAAATLVLHSSDGAYAGELIVLTVGDVVSAVSVGSAVGDSLDPAAAHDLAARAAAKIDAAS